MRVPICRRPCLSGPLSAWIKEQVALASLAMRAFSRGSWYISVTRVGTMFTPGSCFPQFFHQFQGDGKRDVLSLERREFSYWPIAPDLCCLHVLRPPRWSLFFLACRKATGILTKRSSNQQGYGHFVSRHTQSGFNGVSIRQYSQLYR